MQPQPWTQRPLNLPLAPMLGDALVVDHQADSLIGELLQRPETLVLVLRGLDAMVDADGRLALLSAESLATVVPLEHPETLTMYLGRVHPAEGVPGDGLLVADGVGTVPVLCVVLTPGQADAVATLGHGGTWSNLRLIGGQLDGRDAGLLTRAVALANWHARHRYSPTTGRATTPSRGGWVRVDEEDGGEHFPRTDPAVIVAVTDDEERLLLASNAAWEANRYSLIAGFVDPGESLESAVVREVWEEAGVRVANPQYLGSQPWPFPASLMLGFTARLADDRANQAPDGVEIRSLRWFSRAELRAAAESGEVLLPGPSSIARSIVEAWYGERLEFGR